MINKVTIWLFTIVVIAFGLYQASQLSSNYSLELFAFDNQEELNRYESFRNKFSGESNMLIIGLKNEHGFKELDEFIKLDSLITKINIIEGVENVGFITEIDYPTKRGAFTTKEKLLPLNNQSSFERHFQELNKYPDITPKFLSSDRNSVALYINLKKGSKQIYAIEPIKVVLNKHQFAEKHIIGKSLQNESIGERIVNDSIKITVIALIFLTIGFFILFRGFGEVIFLLTNVLISVSLFYFAFWLLGIQLNILNLTIPLLITVLSLSDAVHVMIASRTGNPYKKVGLALLLTSLTTILSFVLFLFTGSSIVIEFALCAILGVTISYFVTRFIAPMYFHILPKKDEKEESKWESLLLHKPKSLSLLGVVILVVLTVLAGSRIDINQNLYDHLDKDSEEYRSLMFYEGNFGGTRRFDIYFSSDTAILTPTNILLLSDLEKELLKEKGITNVFSFNTIAKRFNRYKKAGKPDQFRLPENLDQRFIREVYAKRKELGSNNAVSSDTTMLRISVSGHDLGAKKHLAMIDRIKNYSTLKNLTDLQVYVGSRTTINDLSAIKISSRIFQSLIFALIGVIVLLSIGLRSIRLGIVSLLTNTFPLVLVCLSIILLEGRFNPSNIMILTIVLGVALDDTVHILSSYYNEQKIHNHDSKKALSLTLNSVGSGVLKTSILLSLGFSALFFSDFATNQNSGVYLVIGMITAVLADLLLLPNIILALFTKRDKSHLN